MRTNAFLLTCLAILIATSCSDKAVTPNQLSETETQLIGDWLLLETCGGIDGKCTVPYNGDRVSFTTEGNIYYSCNTCYPLSLNYRIEQKTSLIYGPDTIVTVIVIIRDEPYHFPELIIKHLDDSALTVIEDCIDCYESVYSKD